MSARISTTGGLAGACLAFIMATSPSLRAGSGYLPMTGPTPIRIEVAMVRPAVPLPATPAPTVTPVKIENNPTVPIAKTTAPAPANLPEQSEPSATDSNLPPTAVFELPTSTSYAAHSAADNLLVLTPQMLAEYFKPFPNATNAVGVSVFVPVPVSFTPPTDKNPASSRATYKVQ